MQRTYFFELPRELQQSVLHHGSMQTVGKFPLLSHGYQNFFNDPYFYQRELVDRFGMRAEFLREMETYLGRRFTHTDYKIFHARLAKLHLSIFSLPYSFRYLKHIIRSEKYKLFVLTSCMHDPVIGNAIPREDLSTWLALTKITGTYDYVAKEQILNSALSSLSKALFTLDRKITYKQPALKLSEYWLNMIEAAGNKTLFDAAKAAGHIQFMDILSWYSCKYVPDNETLILAAQVDDVALMKTLLMANKKVKISYSVCDAALRSGNYAVVQMCLEPAHRLQPDDRMLGCALYAGNVDVVEMLLSLTRNNGNPLLSLNFMDESITNIKIRNHILPSEIQLRLARVAILANNDVFAGHLKFAYQISPSHFFKVISDWLNNFERYGFEQEHENKLRSFMNLLIAEEMSKTTLPLLERKYIEEMETRLAQLTQMWPDGCPDRAQRHPGSCI